MRKKKFNLEDAKLNINKCYNKNDVFSVLCNYTIDFQLSDASINELVELAKEKNKTFKK